MKKAQPKCLVTGKRCFNSDAHAKRFMVDRQLHMMGGAYHCQYCNQYHLTKTPNRDKCKSSGRACFETFDAAWYFMGNTPSCKSHRAYKCDDCGKYHLSTTQSGIPVAYSERHEEYPSEKIALYGLSI